MNPLPMGKLVLDQMLADAKEMQAGYLEYIHPETAAAICRLILTVPALVARVRELEAALQEIAAGKIRLDAEHPINDTFSMVGRFIGIAQRVLRPAPAPRKGER